jgi:hypothetical protein
VRNRNFNEQPMKVVTKTLRNLKWETCSLCRRVPTPGERLLHKRSSGYGSSAVTMHLSCLAELVMDEPEFADKELAQKQWEETRELLLAKYEPTTNKRGKK